MYIRFLDVNVHLVQMRLRMVALGARDNVEEDTLIAQNEAPRVRSATVTRKLERRTFSALS